MDKIRGLPREQKLFAVGGAMALFIITLFLKWAGIDGPDVAVGGVSLDFSIKGTDIDSWWIVGLLALLAGGIYVAEALGMSLPTQFTLGVGALAAVLVFFWTLTHMVDGSNLKFGAWLALIVSAIGAVLAGMVWREERT